MDYSDRRAAERVTKALLAAGLPNALFRELHHRETLRDTEGVAEHARWLATGDAPISAKQKVLAHRLHACLEAWFENGSWERVAARALEIAPKEGARVR
jgi:hypothetical protein